MQAHLDGSRPQWSCHLTALCVTRVDRVVLWWLRGRMAGAGARGCSGGMVRLAPRLQLAPSVPSRQPSVQIQNPPPQFLTYSRWQCFGKACWTSLNRSGSFFSHLTDLIFFNFILFFFYFFISWFNFYFF